MPHCLQSMGLKHALGEASHLVHMEILILVWVCIVPNFNLLLNSLKYITSSCQEIIIYKGVYTCTFHAPTSVVGVLFHEKAELKAKFL